MRRLTLLVIVVDSLALGACGGSGGVDPNSLTCSQVNSHQGDVVESAASQLAKQIPGGANNPKVAGTLAGDMDIVCAARDVPHPARAALAMYKHGNTGNSTTSTASGESSSSTTAETAPSEPDGADVSAITTTMKNYLSAVAGGDGQTACAQLTPGEAGAVLQTVSSNGINASSCADALDKTSQALDASNKQTLISAQVTNVQVTSDTATASIQGATQQPSFQKVGGRWLISAGIGFG